MTTYLLIMLLISSAVAFARALGEVDNIPTIEVPSGRGLIVDLSSESSTRMRRFR